MELNLDLINIFLLIVIVLTSSLGLVAYLAKKDNKINQYFFIFTIAATLWSLGMFLSRSFAGTEYAPSFLRLLYTSATLIPFSFIFFIRVFPEEKFNINKKFETFLVLPLIVVIAITLLPNILINGTFKPPIGEQVIDFNFVYHLIYGIYIISYFSICYSILFLKYIKFEGLQKKQITYVIFGTFISTVIGVSTNLVMPFLGDFRLNWLGQIGIIVMVASISYSILKHKLFNLKIVATQFVVFLLCISLFIRLLLSSGQSDLIINGVYLIFSIVIGILLIRSVMGEVKQRERVEALVKDLEKTNNKLATTNDKLALANEKLKELDQLKSEFLSLASHQIRAPLTAIKGYASMIMEKDYGEVSEPVFRAVKTIYESCQNLVVIVNEFLDISRIEQGKMKYEMTDFNVVKLVGDIINELKPNVLNAGLAIDFSSDAEECIVNADFGKIKQVIGNLIDNSIKYTKQGGINVFVKTGAKKVSIQIKDTGIGIEKGDIDKLFGKFVRAKDANKTNVIGTGLGLYVAKQMVEAHKGKVWVESEGVGKGSTFFIELPVKKL